MKKIITILLYASIYCQVSVLDLNGQGKIHYNFEPSSISIGNSWLFSCNKNNTTINSLTSLSGEKKSAIRMFTSFNRVSIVDGMEQNSHSINLLSFTFPVSSMGVIFFGISPYSKTNFEVSNDNYLLVPGSQVSSPIAYINKYNVDGGISQFNIAFAQKFSEFSIGFKWKKLFGNQFFDHKNYTYSINYNQFEEPEYTLADSTFSETDRNYNGSNIELDYRLHLNENSTFALLSNFSMHTSILQSYHVWWDAPNGQRLLISSEDKKIELNKVQLINLALGYSKIVNDKFKFNIEYHFSDPINYSADFMLFGQNSYTHNSIHMGLSREINVSRLRLVNSLSLGMGGAIKQIKVGDSDVYDYNMSFGTSIGYAKNTNNFDLSIQVGTIINPIDNISSEKYMNINLGISASDFWFMKNRREN